MKSIIIAAVLAASSLSFAQDSTLSTAIADRARGDRERSALELREFMALHPDVQAAFDKMPRMSKHGVLKKATLGFVIAESVDRPDEATLERWRDAGLIR